MKREVVYSMTDVLCALIRGDVNPEDLEGQLFWFNCCRCHLFDHIPMEATWAEGDGAIHSPVEIKESDLSPNQLRALTALREAVLRAEQYGRVSWRDQRETQ